MAEYGLRQPFCGFVCHLSANAAESLWPKTSVSKDGVCFGVRLVLPRVGFGACAPALRSMRPVITSIAQRTASTTLRNGRAGEAVVRDGVVVEIHVTIMKLNARRPAATRNPRVRQSLEPVGRQPPPSSSLPHTLPPSAASEFDVPSQSPLTHIIRRPVTGGEAQLAPKYRDWSIADELPNTRGTIVRHRHLPAPVRRSATVGYRSRVASRPAETIDG